LASVGELVYRDVNANGSHDIGESGIAGVEVLLIRTANGDTIATQTTDADGLYYFRSLYPGEYEVVISSTTVLMA